MLQGRMEHAATNGGIGTDYRCRQNERVGRACVSILRDGRHVARLVACERGFSFTPGSPPPAVILQARHGREQTGFKQTNGRNNLRERFCPRSVRMFVLDFARKALPGNRCVHTSFEILFVLDVRFDASVTCQLEPR